MFCIQILMIIVLTSYISAETINMNELNGNWHLRVMDKMDVRKARAMNSF